MPERLGPHMEEHIDNMSEAWQDYQGYQQGLGHQPSDPDFAFSWKSKKKMIKRSGGECETHNGECGFKNLEASHLSHKRGKDYDNPNGGVLECRPGHLERHLSAEDPSLSNQVHEWAAEQIWNRMTLEERQWYMDYYGY